MNKARPCRQGADICQHFDHLQGVPTLISGTLGSFPGLAFPTHRRDSWGPRANRTLWAGSPEPGKHAARGLRRKALSHEDLGQWAAKKETASWGGPQNHTSPGLPVCCRETRDRTEHHGCYRRAEITKKKNTAREHSPRPFSLCVCVYTRVHTHPAQRAQPCPGCPFNTHKIVFSE